MRHSRVIFNKAALEKEILKNLIKRQNELLVEYAKAEIIKIGDTIKEWHSAHHMDRTGNLLNSLCWGVSYQGKLVEGGFYRDAVTRGESYLHEWLSGDTKYLIPVSGRELAESYVNTYGNNGARGWKVFFAILAPYWGYWEKGFKMRSNYGPGKSGVAATYQFAVMTHYYTEVKQDLKPARTRIRVSIAKYDRVKLEKRWERYANRGR